MTPVYPYFCDATTIISCECRVRNNFASFPFLHASFFYIISEILCRSVRLLLKMAAIIQPAKQQQLPLSLNNQAKSGECNCLNIPVEESFFCLFTMTVILCLYNVCRAENGPCGYVVIPVESGRTKLIWIINSNLKVSWVTL